MKSAIITSSLLFALARAAPVPNDDSGVAGPVDGLVQGLEPVIDQTTGDLDAALGSGKRSDGDVAGPVDGLVQGLEPVIDQTTGDLDAALGSGKWKRNDGTPAGPVASASTLIAGPVGRPCAS